MESSEGSIGGYSVDSSIFQNREIWEKYICPVCDLLLKDAVQTSCGHWGCESCVNNILATESFPKCRYKDCREEFIAEDGAQYFKDRFVRREVQNLLVYCDFKAKGCTWNGKFQERDAHLNECEYGSTQCELCGQAIAANMVEEHKLRLCPKAVMGCPYQFLGCSDKSQLPKTDIETHLQENEIEHANRVVKSVKKLEQETKETKQKVDRLALQVDMLAQTRSDDQGYGTMQENESRIQADSANFIIKPQKKGRRIVSDDGDVDCDESTPQKVGRRVVCDGDVDGDEGTPGRRVETDFGDCLESDGAVGSGLEVAIPKSRVAQCVESDSGLEVALQKSKTDVHVGLRNESESIESIPQMYGRKGGFEAMHKKMLQPLLDQFKVQLKQEMMMAVKAEIDSKASGDSRRKDAEITSLKEKVLQLEKTVRAKTAEAEDRDFRLSLIENSNYEGNMVWKIPQFSQRKADAESGKYTSIFSLPFYTGRYGYKMCLRLYILGDGIGKNTHMSLFFVIMRGEFDNILQWPFTHKVTFKLINQRGSRDVIDTFQPDPMSSSFRKPKSDMNVASGCPRFVSHQELQNGGFIEDDTVFIKCIIDKNTIHHP